MNTVLCTTSSFGKSAPYVLETLKDHGLRSIINPYERKLTEDELHRLIDEYRPVGLLAGTEPVTRNILSWAKDYLKVISRVGVGWDNVDRDAAKEFGIQVHRTENVLDQAVAELTLGFILSALRHIPFLDRQIRVGIWQKRMGRLLNGKIVGVIGFGAIGQRVGELTQALGAAVVYFDPYPKDVKWAKSLTLDALLAESNIITVHASGSEQIIGKKEINRLRDDVILLNLARGGLIDETALYDALANKKVAYACLDVFECEPYTGPFSLLDNVVLTPHIGSYALESRIQMEEIAVDNLIKGLGFAAR